MDRTVSGFLRVAAAVSRRRVVGRFAAREHVRRTGASTDRDEIDRRIGREERELPLDREELVVAEERLLLAVALALKLRHTQLRDRIEREKQLPVKDSLDIARKVAGALDYAFASPELVPYVRGARYLNFNAGYPPGVDLELPWLRSSDHDPVIVDLRFRQSETTD